MSEISAAPEDVLDLWFGKLDDHGRADAEHRQRWWKKDPAFDDLLRQRFGGLHREIREGRHESWLDTPRGLLAYVIVLDQFSRNMFRGTPEMFASDAQALRAATSGIDAGADAALAQDERTFLYMPLMHCEALEAQERCVALFERFVEQVAEELRESIRFNLKFAIQHRDIVARFGRFPHRNAILGRETTPVEAEFLTQPGSSF